MTNSTEGLSPYGPGKFCFLVDSYIYQNFNPLEDWGSIPEDGYYVAVFEGPFLPTPKEAKDLGLNPKDLEYLRNYKYGVLVENDLGFVSIEDFPSYEDASQAFDAWVKEE